LYVKHFLGRFGLGLHFLVLKIDLKVDRIAYAAYGHAVVHPIFVDDERQAILRHLQSCGQYERLRRFRSLLAGVAQQLPDVLAALGARFPKFLPPLVQLMLRQRRLVARDTLHALACSLVLEYLLYKD